MRRIVIGGSYVAAVTAGAVVSAQLWIQALSVDERSAIRELALPGTQERSVAALVEPARPPSAKPTVPPSPFTGFTQVFVSPGGGVSVPVPGSPAPGLPVPGSPIPGSPVPGQPSPGGGGGSTPSGGPSTLAGQASTASPALASTNSNGRGSGTQGGQAKAKKTHHSSARATPAVPARRAQPPASKPAARATPAVPPQHAKPEKPKPAKPGKPPKQNETSSAQTTQAAGSPGNGGGNGQGNGKGKDKK